jgi:hypothetical protein
MMQLKSTLRFLEAIEPWNQKIWNMIPKTYKSLKRLADTSTNALDGYNSLIHVFDVCRACGTTVFDGTYYVPACLIIS